MIVWGYIYGMFVFNFGNLLLLKDFNNDISFLLTIAYQILFMALNVDITSKYL